MTADLLRLKGVSLSYPAPGGRFIRVLNSVDLQVGTGRFVAVLGPSGCGKSTLLRVIAGLLPEYEGEMEYVDGDLRVSPLAISMNFQKPVLLPWLSVAQNARIPFDASGKHWGPQQDELLASLLRLVGLQGFADALPAELSGGMNMRAALVRSFITQPKLLLMDEPLSALDEATRTRLGVELRALARDQGTTVIFVTHSVQEAVFLADEVVTLSARPARVLDRIDVDLPGIRDDATLYHPAFTKLASRIRDRVTHD